MPSRAGGKFVPTSDAVMLSNVSRVFAVDELRSLCSTPTRGSREYAKRNECGPKNGRLRQEGPCFSATPHKKRLRLLCGRSFGRIVKLGWHLDLDNVVLYRIHHQIADGVKAKFPHDVAAMCLGSFCT
jgi:hypothetical protein